MPDMILILAGGVFGRLRRNLCGHAVAQLVEALRYKPQGCGFGSWRGHCNLSLT
jgi:hypothetical protein